MNYGRLRYHAAPDDNAAVTETPGSPPPQERDELEDQKKRFEELNDRYLRPQRISTMTGSG